ncbi:MAG: hypothetical protein RIR63_239 [Actinomycetota bacterium]|jgi:hypothetical protein
MRVLFILLSIAIQLYGLIDCAQREDTEVRSLPRWGWLIIIVLVPTIGAIAYLIAGRPKRPGGHSNKKPKRTIAPDDDPDFLRGL